MKKIISYSVFFILLINVVHAQEFNKKFAHENCISGFGSAYLFENDDILQKLIHELKYNKRFSLGTYLGMITSHLLIDEIEKWNIDFIIPIPLFHLKKAERGYNQAYYMRKRHCPVHN